MQAFISYSREDAEFAIRRLSRVPEWAYGGLQLAAVMGRELIFVHFRH